jgi:hypothetical protein
MATHRTDLDHSTSAPGSPAATRPMRGTRRTASSAASWWVGAIVLALVTACTGGPTTEPTSTPASTPTSSPTVEPTPTPTGAPVAVTAYYMIDTRTGLRLARETRETVGADPVRAAVEKMIAGPDDLDYSTSWNPATKVLGISRDNATIIVDMSADARTANIGSAGAALMIQQLVYTVTGAAGENAAPVMMLIEGAPAGELWGAVIWDKPIVRADPISVRLLVQIDRPSEGVTVASPVTVAGDAAVFEATLPWRVLDPNGVEVTSGFTMTTEGQTFAPYSFTVDLAPGKYTIEINEGDPSGGEGGTPMSDTRTVVVT